MISVQLAEGPGAMEGVKGRKERWEMNRSHLASGRKQDLMSPSAQAEQYRTAGICLGARLTPVPHSTGLC